MRHLQVRVYASAGPHDIGDIANGEADRRWVLGYFELDFSSFSRWATADLWAHCAIVNPQRHPILWEIGRSTVSKLDAL